MLIKKQRIIVLREIKMQMHMHKQNEKQWKRRFRYVKLTNQLCKINFQNVNLHTGGNWLIIGTKYCTDNQLQRPGLICKIS